MKVWELINLLSKFEAGKTIKFTGGYTANKEDEFEKGIYSIYVTPTGIIYDETNDEVIINANIN